MEEIKLMTIKENEDFLRQISENVEFNDKSYLDDVKKLEEYCKKHEVFAMSAIQIGIPKKIIYLKSTTTDLNKNKDSSYNEGKVLINPVVISRKGHAEYLEGCQSCLGLVGVVVRPYQTEVEYSTVAGEKVRETFIGMASTVYSHEDDHLYGILHTDRAEKVVDMPYEEKKKYREEHPYHIIDKDSEYDIDKIKNKLK